MHLVRYAHGSSSGPQAGVLDDEGSISPSGLQLHELLRLDLAAIRERSATSSGDRLPAASCTLLVPVEARMEVWAAGVTYERSRDERMKESVGAASIYDDVYGADRPELFFKSVPWRVVADGEPIGIRSDSTVDVPEAELAVVVNAGGEIVGYTVCNDVSSRSIEGENPLYLPQAKIFSGCCALATRVRPAWEVPDPYGLQISVRIVRAGAEVFTASASSSQLHRRLDDLVSWLGRELDFPDGAILSTGTSLVPELPFSLAAGDVVAISIAGVGDLSNPVTASSTVRAPV